MFMSDQQDVVQAKVRVSGKGASHRLRQSGWVPAVVYGHGEPLSVALPEPEARRVLSLPANRVFALHVADAPTEGENVRLQDVAKEPTTDAVLHLDFQRVRSGERLRAQVPVRLHGVEDLRRRGLVLDHLLAAIEVEAEATHVPEHLDLDVARMEPGDVKTVKDLLLPSQVIAVSSADEPVVRAGTGRAESEVPAAGVAAEPAEGTPAE